MTSKPEWSLTSGSLTDRLARALAWLSLILFAVVVAGSLAMLFGFLHDQNRNITYTFCAAMILTQIVRAYRWWMRRQFTKGTQETA